MKKNLLKIEIILTIFLIFKKIFLKIDDSGHILTEPDNINLNDLLYSLVSLQLKIYKVKKFIVLLGLFYDNIENLFGESWVVHAFIFYIKIIIKLQSYITTWTNKIKDWKETKTQKTKSMPNRHKGQDYLFTFLL